MIFHENRLPPIICSRRQFQILPLFQKYQIKLDIFHENRLPADDSHEIYHALFVVVSQDIYHALFVIFEKAEKFEIVVCCKL